MNTYKIITELELTKIDEILKNKKTELIEVEKALDQFNDNATISNLYKDYNSLLSDREPLKNKLKINEKNINSSTAKLQEINNKIENKSKWYHKIFGQSKEIQILLLDKNITQESINRLKRIDRQQQDTFKKIEQQIVTTSNSIEEFTNFDSSKILKLQFVLNRDIKYYQEHYTKLDGLNEEIKNAISEDKVNLNNLNNQLAQAEKYDKMLSNEKEPSVRRDHHKTFEELFGTGNPREIIRDRKIKIKKTEEKINRIISKVHTKYKINERKKEVLSNCKFLIIDGNNFCYKGIDHLIPFTNFLIQKYEVLIMFDKSILKHTRRNFDQIKSSFPKDVEIKIQTSDYEADQSIISYAENRKDIYIISNDKFRDYKNEEAVANNRLIGHEIFDSKILIHDLDINFSF